MPYVGPENVPGRGINALDTATNVGGDSAGLQAVLAQLRARGVTKIDANAIRSLVNENARDPGSADVNPQTLGPTVLNLRNAGIEDASPMPARGGGSGNTSALPPGRVDIDPLKFPGSVVSDAAASKPPGRTLVSDAAGNPPGPVTGSPEPPDPAAAPYIPGPPVQPSPMPASVANQSVSMPPRLATPVVTPDGMVAIDENNKPLGGAGTGAAAGVGTAAAGGLGAFILRSLLGGSSLPPVTPTPPPPAGFRPEYEPTPGGVRGAGFAPEVGQTLPTRAPVAGLPAGPQPTGPVTLMPESPATAPVPETPASAAVDKAIGSDAPAPRAKAPRARARGRIRI